MITFLRDKLGGKFLVCLSLAIPMLGWQQNDVSNGCPWSFYNAYILVKDNEGVMQYLTDWQRPINWITIMWTGDCKLSA